MARRRNSILDAIDAFNSAYDTTTKVGRDIELSQVAQAKPEEMQGFTTDDTAQLEAAANSGQYDIGVKTKDDGSFAGYTVTPKADPTQTGTVAMQGVTDFMGKRTAGSMNDDQVVNARQMAMAGVMDKYDPKEGMRMRREVKSQEREDQRWDRQTKEWDRTDKKQAEQDQYESGRKELFANTRFGQNQGRYQQEMAQYQEQLARYESEKASGKEPGAAPVMPSRPEYSIGDSLADRAALIDHDAKHGKLDPRSFGEFTDLLNKVQGEGYEKALRLAQSGATVEEVAKAFNATGQTKMDPASIVSDKLVKGKDGVETRVIQYKDAQGNVRTVNALAELDALGKAGEIFTRHYQRKGDVRADEQLQLSKNADGRAGAQFTQGQADRAEAKTEKAAKVDAAVTLFKDRNPNASAAEIEAVRRGILSAVPTTDTNSPAEVKLARALVDADEAPDMRAGLKLAMSKSGRSPREAYLDLMKPQNGMSPNESTVANIMESAYGADWRSQVKPDAGSAPAKPLKNVSPADIAATAKKYGISEDEVKRRLGM